MLEEGIHCMDAIDGMRMLEDESVDLIVADPPYNSSLDWDKKDDEWQFAWLREAKRVLKTGGAIYVFFAPLNMYGVEGFIRREFNLKNILVWHHPNLYSAYLSYGRDRYKSTWEVIFYAIKGEKSRIGDVLLRAYAFGSGFDVITEPYPIPSIHKAQKPLKLVMKLVYCSSNEGDLVLDPFVGSGTTAVACKLLRRRFIGFEVCEEFVKLAVERLNNTPTTVEWWLR